MVPYIPSSQFCSASCMYTSLVPAAISVWRVCVFMWEKETLHRLTRSLSRSHTPTLLSHTHRSSESVAVAALPEALAQWRDWSYLLSCMMGGFCMCVRARVCGGLGVSPFSELSACFLSSHLRFCACVSSPSTLPSICPSIPAFLYLYFLYLCFPSQWVKAVVGSSGVGFCSPAAASSPQGPSKTRLLLPRGPQASAALPPNKFAVTLSAIGPWIGSK